MCERKMMKKIALKHGILAGIAVLVIAAAVPAVVGALPARAEETQTTQTNTDNETNTENTTDTTNTDTSKETQTTEQEKATAEANAEARKTAAETRLAATKLKVCQERQQAITNIMARLSDRGQKQLDLFSTIAQQVEAFYSAQGKTLSTYNTLVADVNAKEVSAKAAVDIIKSTSVDFKCDGTDPKGVASTFKSNLQVEISALQAYRTSVKNLIVGVESVQTSTAVNGGTN